jgi:hypothetical protein
VPLELSTCPACGAAFLAGATATDATARSELFAGLAQRPYLKVLVMVGGAATISVVLAAFFWLASVFV